MDLLRRLATREQILAGTALLGASGLLQVMQRMHAPKPPYCFTGERAVVMQRASGLGVAVDRLMGEMQMSEAERDVVADDVHRIVLLAIDRDRKGGEFELTRQVNAFLTRLERCCDPRRHARDEGRYRVAIECNEELVPQIATWLDNLLHNRLLD